MFLAYGRNGEGKRVFVAPRPSLAEQGLCPLGVGVRLKRMGGHQCQGICEVGNICLLFLFPESDYCDGAYT